MPTSHTPRPFLPDHDGVEIDDIGGMCPVQAEGRVDGKAFYFRARGEKWSLSIAEADPIGHPEWIHQAIYGDGDAFAAGWMSEEEALDFLHGAIALYRAEQAVRAI